MRTALRIDRLSPVQEVLDDLLPPEEGPGGSMLIEGIVARPGIYLYADGKGGTIRELVPRSTLWDSQTAETLGRTPVTIEHPRTFVNDSNVRDLSHGDVDGELVEAKGGFVKIKMAIRTAEAKDAIANGKRQLSPGYRCWIDDTPGEDPEFGAYDSVQVRREYNHVALCDAARGGAVCSMRVDSEDEIEVPIGERDDGYKTSTQEKVKRTSTFEDEDGYSSTTTTTVVVNEETVTRFPGDPAEDEPAPFAALDSAIAKVRDAETMTPDLFASALEEFKVGIMEGLAKSIRMAVAESFKEIQGDLKAQAAEPPEAPGQPPADPNAVPGQPPADPNASPMEEGKEGPEIEDDPAANTDPSAKPGEEPPADPNAAPAQEGQGNADPNAEPAAQAGDPQSAAPAAPASQDPQAPAGTPAKTPPEEDPKKPRKDSYAAYEPGLQRVASAMRIDYTRFDSASDLARAIVTAATPNLHISSDETAIGAALALDALGAATAPIIKADRQLSGLQIEPPSIYGSQNQE